VTYLLIPRQHILDRQAMQMNLKNLIVKLNLTSANDRDRSHRLLKNIQLHTLTHSMNHGLWVMDRSIDISI